MKRPVRPVVDEILHQEHPQPIEQGERKVLPQTRTRAPEVAEKSQVIPGAQDVRIDQMNNGQHQGNLENRPDEVVAIVQQCRTVQMHLIAANELPERPGIGQAAVFSETEQAIGDTVGGAEKQDPEAAVQVENAEELLGDGFDYPCAQVLIDKGKRIHERPLSVEGTAL